MLLMRLLKHDPKMLPRTLADSIDGPLKSPVCDVIL